MQISTRVGVVQAMAFSLGFYTKEHSLNRTTPPRKHLWRWQRRGGIRGTPLPEREKENRTLAGPVYSSSARGPTITFQRGTADSLTIAIWEDGQPAAASES